MTAAAANPGHLLLFEPRTEGHHPGWLRFITEDLLSGGMQLTLALDTRPEHESKIRDHLGPLLSEVAVISAAPRSGGKLAAVESCLQASGAANVFLCALDEIASDCWRRASFGIFPPAQLRGRLGGIYHRPRFLEASAWSPEHLFKLAGYRRLLRKGWLRQLLFVDEYLARDQQIKFPEAPIFFLPDPCPAGDGTDAQSARRQMDVPSDKRVFLFYGGGYRRKGLHLTVEAMLKLPADSPAFLLCAGQLNPQGETARGLELLVRAQRAKLVNRYVTVAEEQISFAASDVVLLPYVHHFGTSGVLSRAMAAGRMVIVSDEELLGRLTRDHGLGLLFRSGNVMALRDCIREAAGLSRERLATYAMAAARYAAIYSREAYRAALQKSVGLANHA